MGTPGGFNNFGRERTGREIGEEHRQKLLKQAEVKRIRRELRESREAEKPAWGEAASTRSFSVLWVALRVIALVVLVVVLIVLAVVLVQRV